MKRTLAVLTLLALAILLCWQGLDAAFALGQLAAQEKKPTTPTTGTLTLEVEHRWASDVLKEKRTDGTVWRSNLPIVWRETPDCNACTPSGFCTAMYCPATEHERYTIDVCLLHGEFRVLHTLEKKP